jgi:REP element-mobilizing transposase RayT
MKGIFSPKVKQFLKHTKATAVILVDDEKVIAKFGPLSPEGFQQFANAVQRHWQGCDLGSGDRYVVLPLDDHFQYVCAKCPPSGDYLCGLAFPMDTPLSQMWREMADLIRLVTLVEKTTGGADDPLEQSLQLNQQSMPESDTSQEVQMIPDGWHVEMDALGQLEDDIVDQEPILQQGTEKNTAHQEEIVSVPQVTSNGPQSPEKLISRFNDLNWQPLNPLKPGHEDLVSILQDDFEIKGEMQQCEVQRSPSESTEVKPIIEEVQWVGEGIGDVSHKNEQVTLADTVLDTTFYLVPRLNEHFLLGELAQRLRMWLPKLCERYGWELDLLSIRPDYLKWTLGYFPECLIHDMLAVVRRWTSERIFRDFPTLQIDNAMQDFWSPGYLVDTQNREFPTQVLIAHVARDRSE